MPDYDIRSIWLVRPNRQSAGINLYGVTVEMVLQQNGTELWAIRSGSEVMDHHGGWHWEPSPSNRDEAFLHACRFKTLRDAVESYHKFGNQEG